MANEIRTIVERLNDAPFNLNLTLAAFDEKSPFELLEVVNLVMGELSAVHKIDLRDETPEKTINRMLGFLNMLNFKPGVEGSVYQQALLQGDPQAIHPMLSWLLTRLPELRTRAYLATFLSSVELPEHLAADDELGALLEHLRELQADFKEQHKSLDKLGQQIISPLEIKRAIVQMEEDREQLLRKIEQLSGRLQNLERYEETLAAATGLRQEQDEQMKLQQRVAEQRQSYARAEQQLQALDDALRDARAQDLSSDGESLLRALEAEVGGQRAEFETELPAAIDEARARLDELEGALAGGPITQDALREVRAQLARLDGRERELRAAAAASGGGGDDDGGLGMFRQQAALITHKHKAMLERLQASTNTRDALERQLIAQTAALAALEPAGQRSGVLDTKSDDFKRYTANLRGKTANYGKQRAELSELRAEYGVLYRTEQLLQAQARAVGASLARAEGARGIDGYSAVQSQLDKESDAKAAADEAKGQSLEQISQLVDEINEQIRSRKNRLAPQIKELRALRASSQEVESEHLEKKGLHDSAAVSLEAELSKLQEEVSVYEDDLAKEESRFHYLNSLGTILNVSHSRARAEAAGSTRVAEGYALKLKAQEETSKELRMQQKAVKESFDRNSGQLHVYKDLEKLLHCKIECRRRADNEQQDRALMGVGGNQNVFTMPEESAGYTDIDGFEHR